MVNGMLERLEHAMALPFPLATYDGLGCSTYIWEVIILADLDWVSRHARYSRLRGRTMESTRSRMPPDVLLRGLDSGKRVKLGQVIVLKDRERFKQTKLKVVKQAKRGNERSQTESVMPKERMQFKQTVLKVVKTVKSGV